MSVLFTCRMGQNKSKKGGWFKQSVSRVLRKAVCLKENKGLIHVCNPDQFLCRITSFCHWGQQRNNTSKSYCQFTCVCVCICVYIYKESPVLSEKCLSQHLGGSWVQVGLFESHCLYSSSHCEISSSIQNIVALVSLFLLPLIFCCV